MSTSTDQDTTNNLVNRHPYATGIGLHAMTDFNFRDIEMTLKGQTKFKGHDAL